MHYLDNSATTAVSANSANAVMSAMTENFGNPGSLHQVGYRASLLLDDSRKTIADSLGCTAKEVYFTSGGTEANNLAVLGAANAQKRRGKRIITTAIEHASVLECMKQLEQLGFEVVYLSPDSSGKITEAQLSEAITSDTVLVSVMTVNNETGLLLPTDKIPSIIKRKKSPAIFHTDFVQGYGKLPCRVKKLGCDLLTVSAHKIHAPKGAGVLYVKNGTPIKPRSFGGLQESKLRCGTEALPLIAGFAEAVREFDIENNMAHVQQLCAYCVENLRAIPEITINSDGFPYIINFSTNCIMSQTLLTFLSDNYEVCVSSGSACHKGELSHVLTAYGYDARRVNSAIRVSFCESNTLDDVDALISGVKDGLKKLVRF